MSVDLPKRHSLRLREYDYTLAGAYFVTMRLQERHFLLGNVIKGEMQVNEYGKVICNCWDELSGHYSTINLDAFVVMPNHVHGIMFLMEAGGETPPLRKPPPLGQIIAYFKYQSSRRINELRGTPGTRFWQRNYYEHIIRDDKSLNRIREYIITNPQRWDLDRENPQAKGQDDFDRWLATFKTKPSGTGKNGRGDPAPTNNVQPAKR